MAVKQLSVFLENKEGHLDDVMTTLAGNDINIVAASLADSAEYGILRLIVSDPAKGKTVLRESGIMAKLTDVICLRVPHAAGSLCKALRVLTDGDINIEYMYAFANGADASAVLKTNDPAKAEKALKDGGFDAWEEEEAYKANC